jgi:predicted permease
MTLARMRSWWKGVFGSRQLTAEMEEEFRFHIELRAADLEREGVEKHEALRRARAEFGGVHNFTQLGREARGLAWFDAARVSWLDFKLGGRMIARYPGLTVMAALAIGIAVAIGAGVCGAIATIGRTDLPLDQGDRIVGLQLLNAKSLVRETHIARDVLAWRAQMRSIVDLGAFRPRSFDLRETPVPGNAVRGVEMSASGFRVARVPPFLGRYLVDDDERPDAAPVVVLGYDVWRARFNADTSVVGRAMNIGTARYTIVGVMPKGFVFPVNYAIWTPLRLDSRDEWRAGPGLFALGRLAPGATLDDAGAEIAALSATMAQDHPHAYQNIRARVLPFSQSWIRIDNSDFVDVVRTVRVIVVLLVAVICVNVATLVYARTATRQTEIAVRSALGASRARIVAQFFGEAIALAACGSVVGVGMLSLIADRLNAALSQLGYDVLVPFWVRFDVSGSALAYLVILTLFGAAIIGVLPAIRVTGPRVQAGLQRLAGGHSTLRMGKLWTTLIVAEVAFAVALLPAAVRFTGEWIRVAAPGGGFPADQYLSATLAADVPRSVAAGDTERSAPFRSRFAAGRDELLARLEAEPDVMGVTYAASIPGDERTSRIEVQADTGGAALQPFAVRIADVDRRYFDTFDAPVIRGRGFVPTDADSGSSTVIVNRSFVDAAFHGANAIGRRVRTVDFSGDSLIPGPWSEIIGVVGDFPARLPWGIWPAAIYRASIIGRAYPVSLMVRFRSSATESMGRLHTLATTIRPDFLLLQAAPLEDRLESQRLPLQWLALSLAVITACVLVLSCAGVYALMSVVVARRKREIGIRAAMGADPRRLLSALFSRAATQVGAGVAIGIGVATLLDWALAQGDLLGAHRMPILLGVAAAMAVFAMAAAFVPARTALRISPTEALKAE